MNDTDAMLVIINRLLKRIEILELEGKAYRDSIMALTDKQAATVVAMEELTKDVWKLRQHTGTDYDYI